MPSHRGGRRRSPDSRLPVDKRPSATRRSRGAEHTDPIAAALTQLAALDEHTLQGTVIAPLLAALGFDNITQWCGARERGSDLVATRADEFGRAQLYAIQVKRQALTGKAGTTNSLGRVLDQLGQTLTEHVLDPVTKQHRRPDRCVFFTPLLVSPRAEEDFNERLLQLRGRGIEMVDGPRLVQLLLRHTPATLGTFSMALQYAFRVAQEVTRIAEARVAFEGHSEIDLERLHVDVSLLDDSSSAYKSASDWPRIVRLTAADFARLKRLVAEAALPVSLRATKRTERSERLDSVTCDVSGLVSHILTDARNYFSRRSALAAGDTSPADSTALAQEAIAVRRNGRLLRELPQRVGGEATAKSTFVVEPLALPLERLLAIHTPILLLGGPGAGKTTALRWLTRIAAHRDTRLPILLPLAGVHVVTFGGLLERCSGELQAFGYYSHDDSARTAALGELLAHGQVRLLLDGLDEAGSNANGVLAIIRQVHAHYPRVPIVLSCRDTYTLDDWTDAFLVRLTPFSEPQLRAFINNWFRVHSKAADLIEWLRGKSDMSTAARTPLIAALLCTLFELQADMPSTEGELYERRFDLLLGRWDQAKGLIPLSPHVRKICLRFLEALSFFLHTRERRVATADEVRSIAKSTGRRAPYLAAVDLIDECVRRGVLERAEGGYSLGHLTYQEYLTASFLKNRNETTLVWTKLTHPWWTKVLEFYCATTEDMTAVLRHGLQGSLDFATLQAVERLLPLAPFTSRSVVHQLRTRKIVGAAAQSVDVSVPID